MKYINFSSKYIVKLLNNKDLKDIYNLCVLNETYYKYCPPSPSIDSIRKDMQALPPKKTLEDKYFLGYYENDRLLAVMDLIDKYPNDKTVFIGFFMVDINYQNKGVGTYIIKELIHYLKNNGYQDIRLGYVNGNKQSESFWAKNGFVDTGYRNHTDFYEVIIMNKTI